MTRGGGAGKGEEAAGKVMGPLFPRLHVSDAGRGGGPRAPPRNKMALYEQFTVPSSRFSPPASASAGGGGGGLAPSTSASQVYGYERPMFQPFNVPSNVPAHSSKKINGNSIIRQISSTRSESGRLSSQTNNNGVYAAGSAVECTSQHRGKNVTKNSSGKRLANDDGFMVPSINAPRCSQHSIQEHVEVQEKWNTLCATSPQRDPPAASKSSAKYYSSVNKHLERTNVSDMRSMRSTKAKEKEPAQAPKTVEAQEMSSIQVSKERFGSKVAKVSLMRDNASNINNCGEPHLEIIGRQVASMNGSSMKTQNPTTSKDTVSCNPCTDLDITNRNSYLAEESLKEAGTKRKRSCGHHGAKHIDDLSDSVESISGWEISPDQIVGAIGQKHFWKARRAIQNQQRIFTVQVFELHKLIKVQKSIAASPHVLIEGDPCLGNALVGKKNKLPDGNLKAQTLSIANKDAAHPSPDQPLSKENTEGNLLSPSHDDGLDGNHHGQVTTNQAFTSNPTATPSASGNKQNNWCVNAPQNQWLVPVMSPSEGLVYKPFTGPCPPAGSLLTPFYANFAPLSLPSTAYGVPMPHQQQYMAPPGAPAMPMNYFPPFTLPVMNPAAPASAVEQGIHAAASQPNGNVQSRISCNMSNPSGIWKFYASRDSEPQASSASSPSDRLQGDGNGPVSFFPASSAQNAQPQPSSGSRDKQSHVIRVVPHNAQTASASAARIFRSIQMERQQSDL